MPAVVVPSTHRALHPSTGHKPHSGTLSFVSGGRVGGRVAGAAPPAAETAAAGPAATLTLLGPKDKPGRQIALPSRLQIGREDGDLRLTEDLHLGVRHAHIERRDGLFWLTPLDTVNGVFRRLREPAELADGDTFSLGQDLWRFEVPLAWERAPSGALEQGIALWGTPAEPAWGRLCLRTRAGVVRDIVYLLDAEVLLGRRAGGRTRSTDGEIADHHCRLRERPGGAWLEDLGSTAGTFVRLRAPWQLRRGDRFRLGDQVIEFG